MSAHDHESPVTARRVHPGRLAVSRLGEALGFWCGVLGGRIDSIDGTSATVRYPDAVLVLDEVDGPVDELALEVSLPDLDRSLDALRRVGWTPEGGALSDPDGRRVELVADA